MSRRTLDRWVVARRDGGFERAGARRRGSARRAPRTETEDLAVGLKMENPARTAAQVRRILAARLGWACRRCGRIQRWLAARELTTRPGGQPPEAFGRFEADAVNEIWTADLMNGPDDRRPGAAIPVGHHRRPVPVPDRRPGSSAARTRSGSPACSAPRSPPRHPAGSVLR